MDSLLELRWMLPPLVISLILVGIHGYLGIHVLTRKVIFVDLALAQIAALGAVYAFLLGYDPKLPEDASTVYWFSLAFTVLGAGVFALTRMRHEKVPHEALIGICYATASALSILILSKTPGEGEHLKSMLVGNILLVGWPLIAHTAAIYAAVGVFHFVFYERFLAISRSPEEAEAAGVNVRLWDFLFYLTFGFVITSSVSIAGVLLVFTYLVVPASFAMLFFEAFGPRILVAWAMGTVCSIVGMAASYYGDLPTGPAVVGVFALTLVLGGVARAIPASANPARAMVAAVLTVAALALGVRGSFWLRKAEEEHVHGTHVERLLAALEGDNETAQIEAIHHLTASHEPHAAEAIAELLARAPSDRLLEHAVEALGALGEASVVSTLLEAGTRPLDPDLKLGVADAAFRLRDPRGLEPLLEALGDDPPLLARRRAADMLRRFFGRDFGYDPDADEAARAAARGRIEEWWRRRESSARWLEAKERFE